jgi:hypothetical protein
VRVYVILDDRTSLEHPLGEAVDVLLSREDADALSRRYVAMLVCTDVAESEPRGSAYYRA